MIASLQTGPPWTKRAFLAFVAFGGTAAYAYSFTLISVFKGLAHVALKVGVASGICWPIFGIVLVSITGTWRRALQWADTCLITMAWGMAVLSVSTVLNLLHAPIPLLGHAIVIFASNLTMAYVFVTRASKRGLKPWMALSVWLLNLDLPFILIIWLWP